jgi:hypothetical protein
LRVERGRPPLDAVNDVALLKQETGKVSAILSGDSGNKRGFLLRHSAPSPFKTILWRLDSKVATRRIVDIEVNPGVGEAADFRGSARAPRIRRSTKMKAGLAPADIPPRGKI